MGNVTIYPRGTADITVPAGQSIAISNFGGGIAQIYYLITAANAPPAFQFQQTLENSSVTLGAFSIETIVRIEANNSKVIYDVGASPDTGIGDADTLNGLPSDTADTADTIAARDSSGDIQANAFESTVATGTAPLTVASTTVVPNLNVSQLEGHGASYFAVANLVAYLATSNNFTGTNTFDETINIWNATTTDLGISIKRNSIEVATVIGSFDGVSINGSQVIKFKTGGTERSRIDAVGKFVSSVTTGTAPITVASTTVCTNLNADLLDGQHGSYYAVNSGVNGTFTTTDGKTVTVTNGVITAIV